MSHGLKDTYPSLSSSPDDNCSDTSVSSSSDSGSSDTYDTLEDSRTVYDKGLHPAERYRETVLYSPRQLFSSRPQLLSAIQEVHSEPEVNSEPEVLKQGRHELKVRSSFQPESPLPSLYVVQLKLCINLSQQVRRSSTNFIDNLPPIYDFRQEV